MSDAALEQRRANAPVANEASRDLSTGPRTEEGKTAVCRNGWKHGRYSAANQARFGLGAASLAKMFGKPCLTTCPFHPDTPEREEKPCGLVLDGMTRAGGSCLDKTVYVHALDALMAQMRDGEMDGMHGVLANEVASNLQVIDQVRQAIAEKGIYVEQYELTKEGKVIAHPETGKPLIADLKINPAIFALAKLNDTLGINMAELMVTPRQVSRVKDDEDAVGGFAAAVGAIFARAGKHMPRSKRAAIEHED
ncbi:MAG: hypothetical protein IJI03_12280 [Rudaea sp.]|nr:hypothetical protein [Rudaea sp.]